MPGASARKRNMPAGTRRSTSIPARPTRPCPPTATSSAPSTARPRATDTVVTAAGGLPGELTKNWRIKSVGTFDCEFGFSCMGYEIAGGWGIKMAHPDREVVVFVGDGSYLMMNSDIYSIGADRP